MNFRRVSLIALLGWLSFTGQVVPLLAAPATNPVVRLHWLGLKQISPDTNAAHFLNIWKMSETTALVNQTLTKLARLPAPGNTNTAALLRPLLDDLVTNEFYLEISGPANSTLNPQPSTLLLAIRLPAARTLLWQTNLTAALPAAEISHSRDWTLIGLGLGNHPGTPADFAARIPHRASLSNWLEVDFTPSSLAAIDPAFSSLITHHSSLSQIHLTAAGDAGNVLTRATLDFAQPLALPPSPWDIPTNYIHQPLTSFTAVRGIAGWLATLPFCQDLHLTNPPDQFFEWAQVQNGGPFVTYFAAPLPGASNQVRSLAERLVTAGNPWLATNGQGNFVWLTNAATLAWHDCFIIDPFLKAVTVNRQDFVFGGLIPYLEGNPHPAPTEVIQFILHLPNLVYYDTEQTGTRMDDDFFILQLFRVVFHQSQLPAAAAATHWLKNLEPSLGATTTLGLQTGPAQLTFKRVSTLGFTALELHLLGDWLESPQFPHGLHTLLGPPDQ